VYKIDFQEITLSVNLSVQNPVTMQYWIKQSSFRSNII